MLYPKSENFKGKRFHVCLLSSSSAWHLTDPNFIGDFTRKFRGCRRRFFAEKLVNIMKKEKKIFNTKKKDWLTSQSLYSIPPFRQSIYCGRMRVWQWGYKSKGELVQITKSLIVVHKCTSNYLLHIWYFHTLLFAVSSAVRIYCSNSHKNPELLPNTEYEMILFRTE